MVSESLGYFLTSFPSLLCCCQGWLVRQGSMGDFYELALEDNVKIVLMEATFAHWFPFDNIFVVLRAQNLKAPRKNLPCAY